MCIYIYITISNIWYRIHSKSYYIYIIYISTQVTCSLSPSPAKPHNARMIHRLVWTDLILSHQVMSYSKPIRRSNPFRQGRSWIWSLSFELINVLSSVFCFKSYMIPLWKKWIRNVRQVGRCWKNNDIFVWQIGSKPLSKHTAFQLLCPESLRTCPLWVFALASSWHLVRFSQWGW